MSTKNAANTKNTHGPKLRKIKTVREITEYELTTNGLRVLFVPKKGSGVVTSDIVYFVGSRDEARGETGLAHMFEHMLFKPTTFDRAQKKEAAPMRFERETGVVLNANTWKDRTSYYFSYPSAYFDRALQIEAERMHHVVLDAKEFIPEQKNVLSEYDMYNGDEHFALSVAMINAAFASHPYGHETIGFREDIEDYTTEKLERFYRAHYTPENAVLIIAGDVSEDAMKDRVLTHFGTLPRSATFKQRQSFREPQQEGIRTVTIARPSAKHILALGVRHGGFPTKQWVLTMVAFDLLASGEDSILHTALIDSGFVSHIDTSLEPTRESNMASLAFTLTKPNSHDAVYARIRKEIDALTVARIKPYLEKTVAKVLMQEALERENSLSYVSALVEYASAGAWESFFETESLLRACTPGEVHAHIVAMMNPHTMVMGYFTGTKKQYD